MVDVVLGGRQALVHLDQELDRPIEVPAQLGFDGLAIPTLELGAGEGIGRGDNERVLIQAERLGCRQPASKLARCLTAKVLPSQSHRVGTALRGFYQCQLPCSPTGAVALAEDES